MLKYIIGAAGMLLVLPEAYAQDATYALAEDKSFHDEWGFSGAVRSGDIIYVSGVVAGLREGETDPENAFDRAFTEIGRTLELAGANWGDVVDMTTFHTDIGTQMTIFRKVKNRYVRAPWPAWTAVGVTRLVPPNGLVEIKVVAHIKKR